MTALSLAAAVDVVVHQPPIDLRGDPLARVLGRAVQHGRPAAVPRAARALRDLEREDLPPLERGAELDELRHTRVVARDRVHLVADAARLVHERHTLNPFGCLSGSELLDRLPALDARELGVDALASEPRPLVGGEDQLGLEAAADALPDAQVHARRVEFPDLGSRQHRGVDLQAVATPRCRAGDRRHEARNNRGGRSSKAPTKHGDQPPPEGSALALSLPQLQRARKHAEPLSVWGRPAELFRPKVSPSAR